MSMQDSGGPWSISHSTNNDNEVKVCDICGDAGFDDLLAICSQCNEGAEHVYCMQTLLDTVPPNWVCEECKLKASPARRKHRPASVDLQEHIPTQTYLNGTNITDLLGAASKAFANKVDVVKDSSVSFPSKQSPNGRAAENYISIKPVSKSADNSTADLSISKKISFDLTDAGKLKALSGVEPNGCSTLLVQSQSQSFNDTQSVRTFIHASGANCSKQTSLQPALNSKGSHNSAGIESSKNDFTPRSKLAPSPRRVLSKCSSAKVGDDLLSFLLPSRPKELIRSSSGTTRVSGAGASVITNKMPNQNNNTVNVRWKGSGQNCTISDPKSTATQKSESFDKTDFIQPKRPGSSPVPLTNVNFQKQIGSVPNASSFRDFQGIPEVITLEAGSRNWKHIVANKVSNASGCMEPNSISPAKTPRCYTCGEMGHAAEMCSCASLQESSEGATGSPQRVCKDKTSVCFGDERLVVNRPLVQVQPNKVVLSSKGDLLGGRKELKQVKEEPWSVSNLEGQKLHSFKTVNSNNSKQLPKPTCLSENNEKPSFQAQGVGRLKMEIKTSSPLAYPVPLTPSQNSICSPHVARQFKPGNSCLSVQGRHHQMRPQSRPSLQSVQHICKPAQPSWNENAITALSSHQDNFSHEVQAIPDAEILWQGCLKVASSTGNITYYRGMQAHASNRADPKVFNATKELPAELQVEELQRGVQNDSWPRSFQGRPPASNSIGIFFFPEDMESHDTFYKPLLDRMIFYDLTLRVNLEYAQLLIFPSHLLPEAERRWDDMTYLWGVFRANKGNASLTAVKNLPSRVTTPSSVPPFDRDAGTQSQSPSSVGEVIDMEGGRDLSGGHKNGDKDHSESEIHDMHVNSPFPPLPPGAPFPPQSSGVPLPPLPPGTPPAQPSPPSTPSHSQQGDSPELLSDVSKHILPVEQNTYAGNAAAQRRYKEHTSALDHSSSSPQQHQDGISTTSNLLSCVSEHDVIHIGNCFPETAVQTAGKVLFGVNFKELSQDSKLTSMKAADLVHSKPSELQQSGDGASATSIEKGFCQQLENRSYLGTGGAHICNTEDINSYERAQDGCREAREALHFNQTGTGACGGMDFDRNKKCFSTKVRDRRKTETNGHDEFKENRNHSSKEFPKQYCIGSQREPHCCEKSMCLLSARLLHSGASSCSLSGSPSFSPTRSEITGNGMLMKETNLVSKCHKRHDSPSSSESLATESGQTLSRSRKLPSDISHDDKACIVQETETIGNIVMLQRTTTSNSVFGKEKAMKGLQCNPGFWESIGTATQSIGTSSCGQFLPCLPLFPMEESSTEYYMAEASKDCEVDHAGAGIEQRSLVTRSMPLVEQLERRPASGSPADMEIDSPGKCAPEEAGNGLLVNDPELTLSIPHYRKQGNIWSRVEDELISFSGQDVNLSLSLL